jgi:hypothetical protein
MWPTKVNKLVVPAGRLAMVQLVVAAGAPQSQTGPESWVKRHESQGEPAGYTSGQRIGKAGIGCGIRPQIFNRNREGQIRVRKNLGSTGLS